MRTLAQKDSGGREHADAAVLHLGIAIEVHFFLRDARLGAETEGVLC